MTARPRALALLAALLAAAAVSACSGPGDPAASSVSSGRAAPGAAADGATAGKTAGGEGGVAAVGAPASLSLVPLGRQVVRTASLSVEVPDVRAAAGRARTIAQDAGGNLEAEDAADGHDVLRLRVAPDRLGQALDALGRLGREDARAIGSEDVTEQTADLDSRLATQRTSVERVRALLGKAQALADVVTLEGQLAQREADLESLQARARALHERADLATVTVTLRPPGAAAAPAAGFRDGLTSGVDAFVSASRAAAVVVGALLPFLPLLALGLWGGRRLARRRVAEL